jgi:transmembrane sensor
MDKDRVVYLYQQYLGKTASPEDMRDFRTVLKDPSYEPVLNELLERDWNLITNEDVEAAIVPRYHEILKEIKLHPVAQKKTFKLWRRISIVAASVAFLAICIYFFSSHNEIIKQIQDDVLVRDIVPGKVGATLTLANGEKIRLSDAANGELAEEAGVVINKSADGQVVYQITGRHPGPGQKAQQVKYNTLSTARGENYQLRLPDGSLVWLNAASSLTYPTILDETGIRRVKLEGEAYFEIFKDKKHPFVVESKGQNVEVLGTHFNIKAYPDENIKTTLLEGSVKISAQGKTKILQPGQQSELLPEAIQVQTVETLDAIDWKEGYFMFNRENLESVMNRIARWYNVDVSYEDPELKKEILFGKVSRFDDLGRVLNVLEGGDVIRFKIKNKTIIVSKKN